MIELILYGTKANVVMFALLILENYWQKIFCLSIQP